MYFQSVARTARILARFNFMAMHYRGELPFLISFLVMGLLNYLGTYVLAYMSVGSDATSVFAICTAQVIMIPALNLWWVIGVLRAARALSPFPSFAVAIFSACYIWSVLLSVVTVMIPNAFDIGCIAFLDDPFVSTYTVTMDRQAIRLTGGIKHRSMEDLITAMRTNPDIDTLELDSPGGRVHEAVEIATEVSKLKYKTKVVGRCDSACTFIFLAGAERTVIKPATLGFHQATSDGGADEPDALDEMERIYRAMGTDDYFIRKTLATPPDKVWEPTYDELIEHNIATKIIGGGNVK